MVILSGNLQGLQQLLNFFNILGRGQKMRLNMSVKPIYVTHTHTHNTLVVNHVMMHAAN